DRAGRRPPPVEARGPRPRPRVPRPCRARREGRQLSGGALGRAAAAGRDRAGARDAAEGDAVRRADLCARRRARARGARRDGGARARRHDDGRRLPRAPLRAPRRELRVDDGRRPHRRGGAAGRVLLGAEGRADQAVPLAGRVKLLLLDDGGPDAELSGFEVVREPQDDVVAVLTVPRYPVGEELLARLPALRVVGTASVGYDHVDLEAAERRRVAVVSVPDYCTEEVADHTLALLYA